MGSAELNFEVITCLIKKKCTLIIHSYIKSKKKYLPDTSLFTLNKRNTPKKIENLVKELFIIGSNF